MEMDILRSYMLCPLIPLTLNLPGYLKTRIRWGGGPQLNLLSKYDKWYVIGLLDSSYAILLKSANKIENLKKLTFLAKSSCKKKCLQKQTDISKKL